MTTPWSVPKDWHGETVAILASGPSMSREVAESVRGKCRVIAISNQGIDSTVKGRAVPAFAPWADLLYAADMQWWLYHRHQALRFAGLKVTVRRHLPFPEVLSLEQSRIPVFDGRPTHIATGANSGYQALHIAAHFGAARVLLFGFDMHGKHWFGKHPMPLDRSNPYPMWIRNFTALAPELKRRGVKVVNCTAGSALTCFESAAPEEALRAA